MKPEDKLTKARIQILQENIFFATVLLSLKQHITTDIPTAATDGSCIMYNPDFLSDLTVDETVGLILHELLHVIYRHTTRKGDRERLPWNYAADYAINAYLDDSGYNLPSGGLLDHKYDNMLTEAIYDTFPEPESQPSWGIGDLLEPANPDEVEQQIGEILVHARDVADSQSSHDDVPSDVRSQIEALLNPRLPWTVLLENHVNSFSKEDYSFNRPRKRYLPDFYLPSQHSPNIDHLVVAIDTSGSVSEDEIKTYLTEIESIRQSYAIDKLEVYGISIGIDNHFTVQPEDNLLDLKFSSRYGTVFDPAFAKFKLNPPSLLIFFTDLYVDFSFSPPDFDCLWISTTDQVAPEEYGATIAYE